ncbi:hypothetical protein UNDYM_5952 (plasmid) [Undibacterium sp. YM2]|nr:hypothetical protein UNDYM_5952 [Undibacterium sp. YM2]
MRLYNLSAVFIIYTFKVVFSIYTLYAVDITYRTSTMDYPIKTLQQIRPILVALRKQAGLSQTDLALLLGVTQQSYAKIEANPAVTSVERLFTVLSLLGSEIVLTQKTQNSGTSTVPVTATKRLRSTAPTKDRNGEHISGVLATPKGKLLSSAALKHKATTNKRNPAAPKKITPPSTKKESW